MIGIYKITNLINQHSYVGQSTQIETRWYNHRNAAEDPFNKYYDYPLYRAFRKYGIENFSFEVLEECSNEELNDKEVYWINYYNPEYNQTIGGNYKTIYQKLTEEKVNEIQQILVNDVNGEISHKELAEKYGVTYYTIQDINVGRTWHNSKYEYPLHLSKFDSRRHKPTYCINCGKEITKGSIRCFSCENKNKKIPLEDMKVTREELKQLIRTQPFTTIATKYNVSDNAIRKWCDKFNLPRKKKDINSYSDKEWEKI